MINLGSSINVCSTRLKSIRIDILILITSFASLLASIVYIHIHYLPQVDIKFIVHPAHLLTTYQLFTSQPLFDVWTYERGKKAGPAATKFRKGACTNCGAMTHSVKVYLFPCPQILLSDILERVVVHIFGFVY